MKHARQYAVKAQLDARVPRNEGAGGLAQNVFRSAMNSLLLADRPFDDSVREATRIVQQQVDPCFVPDIRPPAQPHS